MEFKYAFEVIRKIIFEVGYYTLGSNSHPYFATSASEFNQPKTDFSICGQCQNELLTGEARRFWDKWKGCHLKDLTDAQKTEVLKDIDGLKSVYNYKEIAKERFGKEYPYDISFSAEKELSMMPLKARQEIQEESSVNDLEEELEL